MIQRLACLVCATLIASSCNNGSSSHGGPSPMTPPARDSSSTTTPASNDLSVPDVTLAIEQLPSAPHHKQGVAQVDGKELRGKAAFDAVRNRVKDPVALATLAMMFLDDNVADKKPWTQNVGPRVPEQQAIAQPPTITGDTLTYWRFHAQLADMLRCQVALSTGAITCTMAGAILEQQRVGNDPAAAASEDLASSDVNRRIKGIRLLGKSKDGKARSQLIDLALNANDFRERQAAVEALANVGGSETVSAVSRVLLLDSYAEVRQAAATTLGQLHDPAARDALQKAAAGDGNERVKVLASEALKRLRN